MRFAKFLELLFFPSNLVAVLLLYLIYLNFDKMIFIDKLIYGFGIIGTPLAFYIMNKRSKRKTRASIISIAIAAIVFYSIASNFPSIPNFETLFLTVSSFFALGFLVSVIRLKWMISFHVSVLTTAITILSFLNQNFMFLFVFVPLVAWSRIDLKVHTLLQTVLGFVLGLMIPVILFYIV